MNNMIINRINHNNIISGNINNDIIDKMTKIKNNIMNKSNNNKNINIMNNMNNLVNNINNMTNNMNNTNDSKKYDEC